jgi:hypothetical protein
VDKCLHPQRPTCVIRDGAGHQESGNVPYAAMKRK